ncbi:MAG: shikimate kinase [Candidatus Lokiarchaeota archaeon]|nr:shikimate kinase [Candidatus Lokiarchaeota archaeon]
MIKNSFALIGFMASGKTTIGENLVKELGEDFRFIEMDMMIVEKAGKSIPEIFSDDGEIRFREYEIAVCKEISSYQKVVISCGGGVVLNKINIDYLKRNCYIVLLEASVDTIFQRAMKDGKETRPVIDKEDPKKEIEKVLNFRAPFYKAAAEITIDTSNRQIDEIINLILNEIKNKSK